MKTPNFVKVIQVKIKKMFCKHKDFEICKDQNMSSGYFHAIHKNCTSCGTRYIFRRKTAMSPWYRWSKA